MPELPQPSAEALSISEALCTRLRERIQISGNLSFFEFMNACLYDPNYGYYRGGATKIGVGGDFITAPHVSPLFGACIANQAIEILQATGGNILEIGAGTGRLAVDILAHLSKQACLPEHYFILDVSSELRERQHALIEKELPTLLDRVTWLDKLPENFAGFIVANELLDAIPVHRFRKTKSDFEELTVSINADNEFAWSTVNASEALSTYLTNLEKTLGEPFPQDYESEAHLAATAFIEDICTHLKCGLALFIDYGYEQNTYYQSARNQGTLMCHYQQRAHDDPFWHPGLQDLTAYVNFTAIAEAAYAQNVSIGGYCSQAFFLLGSGLDTLIPAPPDEVTADYLRLTQGVKTLTLPGEMGERFKVLGLSKGLDIPLRGFAYQDLRDRL